MKLVTSLFALPLLLAAAAGAHAACVYPQSPQSLPNGNTATKDEMLAAQKQVKEYKAAVEAVYLPCLEQEKSDSIAALDTKDPDFAGKKAGIESIQVKKHNAALDELQAVADGWAQELKAFSAAQKK